MNSGTTSPATSRQARSSRNGVPGCDGLSSGSARRIDPASETLTRFTSGAELSASPPALTNESGRAPVASALRPLLTLEQVAYVLAVSPKTVRRLVARGFPHIRFGRVLRFDPADVCRFL